MGKILNICGLGVWGYLVGYAIKNIANGTSVDPVMFLLASLGCFCHYIGKLFT